MMNINESLQRILRSKDGFGSVFYEEFLSRNPEVAPYFEKTDFDRQVLVITMALTTIHQHYSGSYAAVDHYLQHLGSMHRRRKIPTSLYPRWCESMLITLEKFLGEDWSEPLAQEWRAALDKASATMLDGYKHHIGV